MGFQVRNKLNVRKDIRISIKWNWWNNSKYFNGKYKCNKYKKYKSLFAPGVSNQNYLSGFNNEEIIELMKVLGKQH